MLLIFDKLNLANMYAVGGELGSGDVKINKKWYFLLMQQIYNCKKVITESRVSEGNDGASQFAETMWSGE